MTERSAVLELLPDGGLHGRRKIYTDYPEINDDNIIKIIDTAMSTHEKNRHEIQYLYDYYRGKQDIRCRRKDIRPEINNKITVNRANEIVTFKVSYLLGEPLQYVSRGSEENISNQINILNEYMYSEDKASKDKEVAEWAHICGVGVRMVLPDPVGEEDGSPVSIYTLDPRNSFVIYYSGLGEKPLAGIIIQKDEKGEQYYCVYTKDKYYEIKCKDFTSQSHALNSIPVIEYLHNEARMGAFEIVLPLLNTINTLESNRIDDIEQFVQSFLIFENCDIEQEAASMIRESLGIKLKSDPALPAKVYRISEELSQNGVQTVVDDMYDTVLTITGMPNRNGGSSTSDTGAATIMRDGWQSAESRAKDTELLFNRSEREFLRIVLRICQDTTSLMLKLSDIGLKFTRRNYADIQSKAQVLAEMLNNSKIHPKLAFQYSGMFTDSEEAYRISMDWYNDQQTKMERTLRDEINAANEESAHINGQDSGIAEQEGNQEV